MTVSPRGYRAYRSRPISQRQREDMVLLAHIREQHRLSLNSYGRPRMTEEQSLIGCKQCTGLRPSCKERCVHGRSNRGKRS